MTNDAVDYPITQITGDWEWIPGYPITSDSVPNHSIWSDWVTVYPITHHPVISDWVSQSTNHSVINDFAISTIWSLSA